MKHDETMMSMCGWLYSWPSFELLDFGMVMEFFLMLVTRDSNCFALEEPQGLVEKFFEKVYIPETCLIAIGR